MSALHAEYSNSQTGGIWHSLNRFLFALIVITVGTIAGYRFLPEFTQRADQQRQIEALKSEIDREKQLLTRRQREEALLKSDPEFIGLYARDRLDLRKQNETIFRLDGPRADTSKMRRRE